jgi:S1-C subfamily serine protease
MVRVLVGVLLATSLASSAFAADWAKVASVISKSVVYIESADGSCTGFVINDDAKGQDYILTAAHCDGSKLYADGAAATVIYRDAKTDLMVLSVADLGRPAVKFAKSNPTLGQDVASLGYGWGLEHPMFRTATISEIDTYIAAEGEVAGPFIVTDAAFVGGQSGGCAVNTSGEVVMIVQRGGSGVGLGIGVELIVAKVRRYIGK